MLDPIAKALNLTPIDFKFNVKDFNHSAIEPWNKGLVGLVESPFKGKIGRYTEKQRKLISQKTKEGMSLISEERKALYYKNRDSCNNRRWINKNSKHKRVPYDQLQKWIDDGWSEGRLIKRENGKFTKG